jgi:hypothetical protein
MDRQVKSKVSSAVEIKAALKETLFDYEIEAIERWTLDGYLRWCEDDGYAGPKNEEYDIHYKNLVRCIRDLLKAGEVGRVEYCHAPHTPHYHCWWHNHKHHCHV